MQKYIKEFNNFFSKKMNACIKFKHIEYGLKVRKNNYIKEKINFGVDIKLDIIKDYLLYKNIDSKFITKVLDYLQINISNNIIFGFEDNNFELYTVHFDTSYNNNIIKLESK
jgi:hypothetical protein